jgi:hypothetical protein
MEMFMPNLLLAFIAVTVLFTNVANASEPDLDSCHDDLDGLRSATSDASDAAEAAESKRNDFENCRKFPEIHDLFHDGCRAKRSEYQSSLSDLESTMDDMDSRLQSVQSSCGYGFTLNKVSAVDAAERRLCSSYKRLSAMGLTQDNVLKMCGANMSQEWCKACIGTE